MANDAESCLDGSQVELNSYEPLFQTEDGVDH